MPNVASSAHPVVLSGIPSHEGLLPGKAVGMQAAALRERNRERWRQLLEIHAESSAPLSGPGPGHDGRAAEIPQWSLRCSRKVELHALCCKYLIANKDHLLNVCSKSSLMPLVMIPIWLLPPALHQ